MSIIKNKKLKKGDVVIVIAGGSKGQFGKISSFLREDDKVIVDGVGIVTKHKKPTQTAPGGIIKKSMPIHVSNVALFDEVAKLPVKVGFKVLDGGIKKRINKRTGEEV